MDRERNRWLRCLGRTGASRRVISIVRYRRPSQAGPARIRHRDGRSCMIGTNAMSIWGRPDKRMAGNAQCSLRPKTDPIEVHWGMSNGVSVVYLKTA